MNWSERMGGGGRGGSGGMAETLRLGVYGSVPEVYPDCFRYPEHRKTFGCPCPGWCIEVVNMITSYLNISLQPVLLGDRGTKANWGDLQDDNTTWNGALGAIQNGTIDTVCLLFQSTSLRSEFFDFSTYTTTSRSIFVTREPREEFSEYVAKVFRAFEVQLWGLIIAMILVQTGCMIVCYWLEGEVMGVFAFRPFAHAWQTFRFFIVQPEGRYRRRTYGGNILMSMCAMATLLATSLYSGLLLTRLLDPPPATPFSDANEMIASVADGKYRLITNYANNWFFDDLRHSDLSYFAKLRKAHSHSPVIVVGSVAEALQQVNDYNLIYPTQEDSFTIYEAKKRCGLVYVNNTIGLLSMHFAFRKGHPLLEAWNGAMVQMQTFMVKTFDKYMRDDGYMTNEERCRENSDDIRKEGSPLTIHDVMGAFVFLGAGFAVSLLLIVVEHIMDKSSARDLLKSE